MLQTKPGTVLFLLWAFSISAAAALGQMPGYPTGGYPVAPTAGASAAAPLPLYATHQLEFSIPFTVDRRIAQPIEVHLYVSTDQGNTWKLHSRQPPTTRQFTFQAPRDGEYWFASRTLDAGHRSQQQNSPKPELRVVVDTVRPQIEFTARPDSEGGIMTSWQVFDQNLLPSSLKIEYQEGAGKPWHPVAIRLPNDEVVRTSYQGQTTWWPETRSPTINIRAEVRDRAGNMAVANRRLLLPALVPQQARGGRPSLANRQPDGAIPWPADNQTQPLRPALNASAFAQQPSGFPSNRPPLPHPDPALSATAPSLRGNPTAQLHHLPATPASSTQSPTLPSRAAFVPPLPTMEDATMPPGPHGRPVAMSSDVNATLPLDQPNTKRSPNIVSPLGTTDSASVDVAAMLPPGERPQMTNSTRFHLEYDVDAVGPSGVAEVQLWATADGGRTWRLWGTDDDLQSPFEVAVEEEGIFGFHVVIVGKNGMSGRRPRSGDLADIWVGVDTTAPNAKLTGATYGKGADTGKLLITWQASDRYPDPRPITLSFSESPDGPWTIIVSSLADTGKFAWPADPQLPPEVYLKLDVRDEAGNLASDQTSEPVAIDGLAPKARIRGIQPVRDMDREAFRVPRRG